MSGDGASVGKLYLQIGVAVTEQAFCIFFVWAFGQGGGGIDQPQQA
jgi:hypothetical protein